MSDYVIELPVCPLLPVVSGGLFPVRRIFCIGRNYADHVKEMGADPKKAPPVFFTKPADAVVQSGSTIPYPLATDKLHFEGELVIALRSGGRELSSEEEATALVYGYAAGCDLTRRDLQEVAKRRGGPWDTAKAFDNSAPLGAVVKAEEAGDISTARLVTTLNGEVRQDAPLAEMIWSVPEIIIALSALFELKPGDLILTGTPAGVGPLRVGDKVDVTIGPLPTLEFSISERA